MATVRWTATERARDDAAVATAGLSIRQRRLLSALATASTPEELAAASGLPLSEVELALRRFATHRLAQTDDIAQTTLLSARPTTFAAGAADAVMASVKQQPNAVTISATTSVAAATSSSLAADSITAPPIDAPTITREMAANAAGSGASAVTPSRGVDFQNATLSTRTSPEKPPANRTPLFAAIAGALVLLGIGGWWMSRAPANVTETAQNKAAPSKTATTDTSPPTPQSAGSTTAPGAPAAPVVPSAPGAPAAAATAAASAPPAAPARPESAADAARNAREAAARDAAAKRAQTATAAAAQPATGTRPPATNAASTAPAAAPTPAPAAPAPVAAAPAPAPAPAPPPPAPAPVAAAPTPAPAPAPAAARPATAPAVAAAPREGRLIDRVEPAFPRNVDADTGTVRARLSVSATGAVTNVEILASDPPRVFDRNVRTALQQWRYEGTGEAGTRLVEISFKR
ncbi:MAG: TonB family protein [Burkholderiales bacterium]|nr:MAG: TonB family protein [Burkholderiales bacterium]